MKHRFWLQFVIVVVMIVCLDLVVTYFLTGRLILKQYLRSASKQESIDRELFLDDNFETLASNDIILQMLDNIEIWRDKQIVVKQIGISPIRFQDTEDSIAVLNIRPKIKSAELFISFNDSPGFLTFEHGQELTTRPAEVTTIKFYRRVDGNIIPIGELKVIPN